MTDQARIAAIVDTQLSQRLRGGANYANRYAPKMAVFHEAADEIDFLIATLRKHIAVSQVAQVISDKFIVDEAQGYSSRDRQYVIEMLKPYLADACKAALSDALRQRDEAHRERARMIADARMAVDAGEKIIATLTAERDAAEAQVAVMKGLPDRWGAIANDASSNVERSPPMKPRSEVERLRSALQRIANLPLRQSPHSKVDPAVRARQIAVVALGGNHRTLTHSTPDDNEPLYIASLPPLDGETG